MFAPGRRLVGRVARTRLTERALPSGRGGLPSRVRAAKAGRGIKGKRPFDEVMYVKMPLCHEDI